MNKSSVYVCEFEHWDKSVEKILSKTNLLNIIPKEKVILLKPNLVNDAPPPITTPVELVEAIVKYLKKNTTNKIIIGEGTGDASYDTWTPFEKLGYTALGKKYDIELIDLNTAKLVELHNENCYCWKNMYLPEVAMDSFLFSIPVLKAHSIAEITLTMKNMMGILPPKHYNAGSWKKSAFHQNMHESIFDLNLYRTPDFTLLDATVGMAEAHLWGAECNPHPNKLIAYQDSVAGDVYATGVLNFNWKTIKQLSMANKIIGNAVSNEIVV